MTEEATVRATFDEIAKMAKEERALHPAHDHYREVEAALENLRVNVRALLGAAGTALSLNNPSEAENLRAQAVLIVAQARPVWAARVETARAERERIHSGIRRAQSESLATMLGGWPPGRGADVQSAAHALHLRLGALGCDLSKGDETDFNSALDAMEAGVAAFKASIGLARRESRLRVAAARADAAVSAMSAEAA